MYFGDDAGYVICTLASGDDVKKVPTGVPPYSLVSVSALKPRVGQPGVLYWCDATTITTRMEVTDTGVPPVFSNAVTIVSKGFATTSFVRQLQLGEYVSLVLHILHEER